jgi:hypothetical protein
MVDICCEYLRRQALQINDKGRFPGMLGWRAA